MTTRSVFFTFSTDKKKKKKKRSSKESPRTVIYGDWDKVVWVSRTTWKSRFRKFNSLRRQKGWKESN